MPYFDHYERRDRRKEHSRQTELADRNVGMLAGIARILEENNRALVAKLKQDIKVIMQVKTQELQDRLEKEVELLQAEEAKRWAEIQKENGWINAENEEIVRVCAEELKKEEGESVVDLNEPEILDEKIESVEEVVGSDEALVVDEIAHADATLVDSHVESDVEREELHAPCDGLENDAKGPQVVDSKVELSEASIVEGARKGLILVEAKEDAPILNSCSSFIESYSQVHAPQPNAEDTGLLDPAHIGGKLEHTITDPFVAHVDVYPSLSCYDYIATFPSFFDNIGSSCQRSIDLKAYLHFVFDPGISLKIVVVCSRLVRVAEFYDVLLIRGRILSNREGMM